MKRVLENKDKTAFLDQGHFPDKDLVEACVEDVKDKLMNRPKIIIYGRVCYQRRDIGFFSDESMGFHYSRKIMKSKPLSKNLKILLKKINKIFKTNFNGIIVNRYCDFCEFCRLILMI